MVGKVLKGRYEILEKIGEGGMAEVYKARDIRLGRLVAMKILRRELASDPEFLERFNREARSAAKLSHPNIISVYDIEEDEGLHFILMEYLEAVDLRTYIAGLPAPPSEKKIVGILKKILEALAFAHKNGIVHRDLKPRNILIAKDEMIKVTDFGIARALFSDTLTQTGTLVGSVHYFSPEQAQGGPAEPAADLYSLGIVMFELLCGRLPFEGDNPISVALKHVQETPPLPSSLNPSISSQIERIILKALQKQPERRYTSAEEFIRDLEDFEARKTDAGRIELSPTLLYRPAEAPTPGRSPAGAHASLGSGSLRNLVTFTLALIFLAFLIAGIIYTSRLFQEVETPDLQGLSPEKAQTLLDAKGLHMRIRDEIFSDSQPAGVIISQEPNPGGKIRPGSTVMVILSKGRTTVEVPNLVGITLDRAKKELRLKGIISITVSEVFSDTVPRSIVISQRPAPDNTMSPSMPLHLEVSLGPKKESVPDLCGKTHEEARRILSRLKLNLHAVRREPSARVQAGCVLSQDPLPGAMVTRNSTVRVVLSQGLEGLLAPDLVGKTIAEAREILEPLGLSLQIEGEERGADSQIISQEPWAQEQITEASIKVKASKTLLVPDVAGKTLEEARSIIKGAGFEVGRELYQETGGVPENTVLEQEPEAGLESPSGTAINLVIAKARTKQP